MNTHHPTPTPAGSISPQPGLPSCGRVPVHAPESWLLPGGHGFLTPNKVGKRAYLLLDQNCSSFVGASSFC